MPTAPIENILTKGTINPVYFNIEYFFIKIFSFFEDIWNFIISPKFWYLFNNVISIIAIFCLVIIIYSFVRMHELQKDEKEEMRKKIAETINGEKAKDENGNYRWNYIMDLTESFQESDWKIAILEADSLLKESLDEKGFSGETLRDLLESAKDSGFQFLNDAWEAHKIRNQIAHGKIDFSLTQVETKKVIKKYQNFFEEIGVI